MYYAVHHFLVWMTHMAQNKYVCDEKTRKGDEDVSTRYLWFFLLSNWTHDREKRIFCWQNSEVKNIGGFIELMGKNL